METKIKMATLAQIDYAKSLGGDVSQMTREDASDMLDKLLAWKAENEFKRAEALRFVPSKKVYALQERYSKLGALTITHLYKKTGTVRLRFKESNGEFCVFDLKTGTALWQLVPNQP
jgi:hypothetical protein